MGGGGQRVSTAAQLIRRAVTLAAAASVPGCGGGAVSNETHPRSHALPSSICEGIDNSHECAQAIERHQLSRGVEGVARRGDRLVLTLANGNSVSLEDVRGDAGIAYNYRQFLPELRRHLIAVHYWEGREYLLVHARSGERTEIQSLPVIAPDRARFVTTSSDLGAEYDPTAIQIWRARGKRLQLEWNFEPLAELSLPSDSVWGPTEPVWLSSREIKIRKRLVSGLLGGYIRVQLGKDGWTLIEET